MSLVQRKILSKRKTWDFRNECGRILTSLYSTNFSFRYAKKEKGKENKKNKEEEKRHGRGKTRRDSQFKLLMNAGGSEISCFCLNR